MEIKSAQIESSFTGRPRSAKLVESNPVIDLPPYGEVRALCLFTDCPGWQTNDLQATQCKYGHPKPNGYLHNTHCLNQLFCQKCINPDCKMAASHGNFHPLPFENKFIIQEYNGQKQRIKIQLFKFANGNYYRNINKYFGEGTVLRLPVKPIRKMVRVASYTESPASQQATPLSPASTPAVSQVSTPTSTPTSIPVMAHSVGHSVKHSLHFATPNKHSSMIQPSKRPQQPIGKSRFSSPIAPPVVEDVSISYDVSDAEDVDDESAENKHQEASTPIDYKRAYEELRAQTNMMFQDILRANRTINEKADKKFNDLRYRIKNLIQELNEIQEEITKTKNEFVSDMDEITANVTAYQNYEEDTNVKTV